MFGMDETSENSNRRKIRLLSLIVAIGFCVYVLRLGYLQIICGDYFSKRSDSNRFHSLRLIPPRGCIYDRNGKGPIVSNETAYDVCIVPDKIDHLWHSDTWHRKALQILSLTPTEVQNMLERGGSSKFTPIVIKENIDKRVAAYLAENSSHMPELIIRARPIRRYENLAAHVIGYTAPVREEDIQNGYALNDVIGRAGLEAEYEEYLKGDLGWRMVEVNTFGQTVRELPIPANMEPGKNLYLTLDIDLQRKAEEIMEGKAGAIVAVDPRDGGILAMVSKPDFDPNIFISGRSSEDRLKLMKDPANPLLNRAIMGEYPPGSTFKIITTTAALTEGKIDETTHFHCSGSIYIGGRTFRCHKAGGHGTLTIHRALPQSCNVFFYNVAYRAGVTVPMLHKYASMYGLGKRTGIDLPGERCGYIPQESTYPGDKINMAIGQGPILVTPLQMVNVISVIANRGVSFKPHIVDTKPEILVDLRQTVPSNVINLIRESLRDVARHGLSKYADIKGLQTCGKTGTAQNPHGDEHAWFIGFAPFDNPSIAVAVLVENAGRGSEVAAPIAGQLFAQYLFGKRPTVAKNADKQIARVKDRELGIGN